MKLSQIGELPLLEQIRKRFKKHSSNVLIGIGDDAALIKASNENLLITTDMMVEGIHFNPNFITPFQVGFKLVSVNVSDVFAMGGKPKFLLLNIAMNKSTDKTVFDTFLDGVNKAMNLYGLSLIGGDISASFEGISVSATVIGYTKKYIKRSGARVGDRIYVTGNLGDSACGLELLKKIGRPISLENSKEQLAKSREQKDIDKKQGVKSKGHETLYSNLYALRSAVCALRSTLSAKELEWDDIEPLLRRHLMPVARDPKTFSRNATSMIDISDGLLIDLSRICDESKVGARIYTENIPLSSELKKVSSYLGISPIKLALSGGEDYELLMTIPAEKKNKATCIGDITESGRVIVDILKREQTFIAEGYQHFGVRR
jgi:thiamine-monophosphate kinase